MDVFMEPRIYLYIDQQGIESLIAQLSERTEIELKRNIETNKSEKVSGKFSITNALAALIGINVGVDAEIAMTGKKVEEIKYQTTIEQKIRILERALVENNSIDASLNDAVVKADKECGIVYVRCHETWNAPQFQIGGGGVENVNLNQGMAFEKVYGITGRKVVMTAGLAKFTRCSNKMGFTSHESLFFNSFKGLDVPLNVLGYLKPLMRGVLHLKPFAIWL
jgi:hypothetical protein